ncbi:MAG: hypothetical protein MI739_01265 [Bacteroidales bacterium]|nr:hypothetical protein [Bacteroidales bacterium]
MKKYFYMILNLEEDEGLSVFLFLLQSVFIGIFYGAFDVGAHALFLGVYPAAMIPKAYVVSGVAGIVLTSLYARIQKRIPFSRLAFISLLFISISAAVLRMLFQYTESNWLIFIIFIMMGPLNIIALLSFWGAVGRIFSLRQGKRLFGLIDSGQIFGAILSTFAIPILVAVGFQQKNLLFVSSISIGVAFIIQIIISIKFNLNKKASDEETQEKKPKRISELFKNKYILYMSIFVVMSMLTAFFIQYSFLSVTKDNYPNHDDLTEFLGAFTGSLLLFTFLFKTFLYSKLMKTYGLKTSIIISPFLVGIFTLLASIIGSLWGYTTASASFMFFFLIISLGRLFSKVLKDAVEVPSFKILYQSLKVDIRHDVQAYVDGTINEIAALASGLLLAVLGLFEFFTLLHYSYALLIILFVWFLFSKKLYAEYKVTLQESLAEFKAVKETEDSINDYLNKNLDKPFVDSKMFITGLEFNSKLAPFKFEQNLKELVKHKNPNIKLYAKEKIVELKLIYENINFSELSDSKIENRKYNEILDQVRQIKNVPSNEDLILLSKDKSAEKRILATYLIEAFYNDSLFVYMKALIRDIQPSVKIAAIRSATKLQLRELCSYIIDYLDSDDIYTYAYDAIIDFDQEALYYLDLVFYKSGTSERVLIRILKLMAEIGGEKAIRMLLKKLDHPSDEVLHFVLQGLQKCDFNADESNIIKIHQIIEKTVGIIAWNIAADLTLSEHEYFTELREAFEEEISANFDLLYLLLSLAYDAQSVMHVKENLESGTAEGSSYALELLDLFISEEIKPKLFPVVEDISIPEKIRQLQNFYPVGKLSINELLIDIVNRDVNYLSVWTKACALNAINKLKEPVITDDIVAHMFNPNSLLRETSSIIIQKVDVENYFTIKKRLSEYYQDELEQTLENINNSKAHLLFEKTLFLKSIDFLKNVPSRYLFQLADFMYRYENKGIDVYGYDSNDLKAKIALIKGDDVLYGNEENYINLESHKMYILDDIDIENARFSLDYDACTVYLISEKDFLYNVFDFYEIEVSVLKWFNKEMEASSKEIKVSDV